MDLHPACLQWQDPVGHEGPFKQISQLPQFQWSWDVWSEPSLQELRPEDVF